MVHAIQRTLQAFLLDVSMDTAEEVFEAVLGCQPDYNMLARQFIDTNSASDRADLVRGCSSAMQLVIRYPAFNTAVVQKMQAQRAHHPVRPSPRRTPQKAQGIMPGAAAPAPRTAARTGGAQGPAGVGSTPRGAPVAGQASGARSWVPVSAAGATAGDSCTPRGAPVPGKASAAQSSKASVASASFGSTPRGAPVAGRAGHAKSKPHSAQPGPPNCFSTSQT